MIFELNETQIAFQDAVRKFAQAEIAPRAAELDEKELFDRSQYDKMGEQGFAGICYPEEFGGSGADYLSYILTIEELSRADDSAGVTLSASVSLCAWPIYAFGTEEQKKKYLTPLCTGEKLGAFGLTEPNAGTDAAAQKSIAVLNGDHYILNGSKVFITNAGSAETYVVFAMTDRSKGLKGITAFILEKGMPGFTFGKKEHKLGIRASQTMELIFQDVKVPVANRLGQEGEGFKVAMQTLDGGRIGIAAQALGIAQAALDHAVAYAKERVQFGKPISANQAISFKIADMAMKLDAARLLTYRAAYLKENKKPYSKEAAMAKCFAGDAAMAISIEAVQIMGGNGYSREYPVERLMRNAKITQIYEGTNEVQRMVISGAVLR
ncbi:MAG: acyl-CoA dehydrogenase [Rhodospirillaceae bacterium]|nr:acyl-CoA dehydrogenase [Rhodospirillaceae bacterium]